MTAVRRRGLQIDDPLGPTQPTQSAAPPTQASEPAAPQTAANRSVETTHRHSEAHQPHDSERARQDDSSAPQPSIAGTPRAGDGVAWRAWSGITGVGSFRLPHEMLVELSDTARRLGLPIGMIVTAAITQLLDQPPEQIAALVDRADDARIHGRRNARRRLSGPPER